MARMLPWPTGPQKIFRSVSMTGNLIFHNTAPLFRLLPTRIATISSGQFSASVRFSTYSASGSEEGNEAEDSREGWSVLNALRKLRAGRKLMRQSKKLPAEDRDAVRSEADIASVVEQRVQQAFREGEFEKLHGSGKPLLEQSHPYNDPADEMAYRLLKKSGFAPDWVELNRDIRFQIRRWRKGLEIASIWRHEGGFQRESWGSVVSRLEEELVQINKKVAHYNLIVPYGRQVMLFKMERELKALEATVENNV